MWLDEYGHFGADLTEMTINTTKKMKDLPFSRGWPGGEVAYTITCHRMQKKWHRVPASTKRCQMGWL